MLPASPELQIIRDQWYAAGLSTNDPDRFQGYHEEHVLVVVDEAAGGVPEDIHEAIDGGVLTSEHTRLLLLGNPTAVGGTFHKAFRSPGYSNIHISAFDTPNFTAFGITEQDFYDNTWEAKITGPLPNPKLITPRRGHTTSSSNGGGQTRQLIRRVCWVTSLRAGGTIR